MKLYCDTFENTFPLRTMKINKKFIKREPWVTSELLVASRQKLLLAKKIRKPTEINKLTFREFNNDFNRSKHKCKINY